MVTEKNINRIFDILKEESRTWKIPSVTAVAEKGDPFKVLISCLISLRTRDEVTAAASARLFSLASSPEEMARLSTEEIEKAIYPAGFYRNKAEQILRISGQLEKEYHPVVPQEIEELLKFKGVGRKTANLIVTLGYKKPGICVDIHVHRIVNRWGYVKTVNPDKTEQALRDKLPPKYWIVINDLLVGYGQNICTPLSPHCSICRIFDYCIRAGVKKTR